jgi:integrase
LPASPETVAAFLAAEAGRGLAVNTLRLPAPLGKKTALVVDRLQATLHAIPKMLPGLRDRALLLVGFAAALRPSEIASLTIEHITRHTDGIELFLPWRKNDQDARAPSCGCRKDAPICVRSRRSRPGSPPRRSPKGRCSGTSGACRRHIFQGV